MILKGMVFLLLCVLINSMLRAEVTQRGAEYPFKAFFR